MVNGIDRRFERKATIVNEIRKVIRKDSSLTLSEIAKATRHSVNTIKTYYPFATKEIPLSKSDTVKVSKTDIRQLNNYYVARPSVIFVHFWTKVGGMELALSSFKRNMYLMQELNCTGNDENIYIRLYSNQRSSAMRLDMSTLSLQKTPWSLIQASKAFLVAGGGLEPPASGL